MNHHEVLASDLAIPIDQQETCITCGRPALRYWPCVSKTPQAYCEVCLVDAKTKLEIALGAASALNV